MSEVEFRLERPEVLDPASDQWGDVQGSAGASAVRLNARYLRAAHPVTGGREPVSKIERFEAYRYEHAERSDPSFGTVEVVLAADHDAAMAEACERLNHVHQEAYRMLNERAEAAEQKCEKWIQRTKVELDNAEAFEERMRAAETALAEANLAAKAADIALNEHLDEAEHIARIVTAPDADDLEALRDVFASELGIRSDGRSVPYGHYSRPAHAADVRAILAAIASRAKQKSAEVGA